MRLRERALRQAAEKTVKARHIKVKMLKVECVELGARLLAVTSTYDGNDNEMVRCLKYELTSAIEAALAEIHEVELAS